MSVGGVTPPSLGTRTIRATAWAYGSYVGGRLLVLLATAILARLLTPDAFGLVALALSFMLLLETLAEVGLGSALLIGDEDDVEERAETVFALCIGTAGVLLVATAALGPVVASFFGEPALVGMLPALGASFVFRAFGLTHYALAQRRMDFRSRAGAEIASVVVRGLVSIALAIAGLGAWSLVLGYIAGSAVMTVVVWALVPWRPRFTPRRSHLRPLLAFGGPLTGVSLIAALIAIVDNLFVQRALGTAALGIYTLAFRLPELLIMNFAVVSGRVLFPAFASLDRAELGRVFVESLRYTLLLGLPLAAGLIVLAEPLVLALFGDRWRGSAPPMQLLAVYALAITAAIPGGTVFKALGRADVLLKIAVPWVALLLAGLVLFIELGIIAAAISQAVAASLAAGTQILLAARWLGVGALDIWRATRAAVLATAGMAVAIVPVPMLLDSPWAALVAGAAVAAATYGALLWFLARDALRHLVSKAFPGRPARVPHT